MLSEVPQSHEILPPKISHADAARCLARDYICEENERPDQLTETPNLSSADASCADYRTAIPVCLVPSPHGVIRANEPGVGKQTLANRHRRKASPRYSKRPVPRSPTVFWKEGDLQGEIINSNLAANVVQILRRKSLKFHLAHKIVAPHLCRCVILES